jgi:hypothetical protein
MAHAQTHPTARTDSPVDVHEVTDWRASVWAGLIAGLVFLIAEMLMVWLVMGQSPWGPPRMMAAMALGRDILPPPDTFSTTATLVAMMIHFPLSVVYGLLIGWMVHRMDMAMAAVAGIAFGLIAIYFVNFYMIAPALFPWFVDARNAISAFAHGLFGAVAAAAYVGLREPRAPQIARAS